MSNPYGWSPPTNGQPAVYFAPPGQAVPIASSDAYGSGNPSYAPAPATYAPGTSSYGATDVPYDNGYGKYQSSLRQSRPRLQDDPFAQSRNASPFSLASHGARGKVSFIDAQILWLKNWRNFSGRASQSEYWRVQAAQSVVRILTLVLVVALTQMVELTPQDPLVRAVLLGVVIGTGLVVLLTIIPNLSLMVRRLHDTNRSGWYYFITWVPFGSWVFLYRLTRGSDPAGWRFDDYMQPLYGPEDLD